MNVRWPTDRFLKQRGSGVDSSPVDSGLRDRVRSRAASEHGFTLIEVLVAALITLIISAGVATALISATDYTALARGQSSAQAVAEQDQERLKSMSDAQLTALQQTRTVTVGGSKWTVTSSATFLSATGQSSCTSLSTAYFKITSTITGATSTGGTPGTLASIQTIITRPLAGSLVVPVDDQIPNTPLSGVGITVVGQTTNHTESATTDANGCVAFAGLPTDTYTITATDPGYVDPNGNASPSESASVNQNGITSANAFHMGAAGNLKVAFYSKNTSGTVYAPNGYETSYYGQGSGLEMANPGCVLPSATCTGTGTPPTYNVAGTAGNTPVTLGSLFPFYISSSAQYTNNYQVWAGACPQEQPLQPPSGMDLATVDPGQGLTSSPDVTVDEPALDVVAKYGSSYYVPSHVTLTFLGDNSSGTVSCTDVWDKIPQLGTEPVGAITYGTYAAPFASTATAGSSNASSDGLAGTISVCADYAGHRGTLTNVTNTNFGGATQAVVTVTGTGLACS
jgi:prepilin-type N-terminal cleavage/methylation domain-containing protein